MNGTHPAGKGGLSAGCCGTGGRRGPRTEEGAGRAQGHFPGRPEEDPDLIGWRRHRRGLVFRAALFLPCEYPRRGKAGDDPPYVGSGPR